MVNLKDGQIAKVKSAIIKVLDAQSLDYHMIVDVLQEVFDEKDLTPVGNCLRVLKKHGYIEDIIIDGVVFWKRTEKDFDSRPPIKVLVPFSAETHQKLVEKAKLNKRSRVSLIREFVDSALDSK